MLRCGPALCAVSVATAVELVPLIRLTGVPGAPPYLLGLLVHRSQLSTVVDIAVLLGLGSSSPSRRGMVVRAASGQLVLPLTHIQGPVTLELMPALGMTSEFIVGVTGEPCPGARAVDTDRLARFLASREGERE